MFQAYVAVGFKKHVNLINANPYTIAVNDQNIYLQEITKEEANGLVFYMLEELTPEEIFLFKDSLTVIGVNGVVKLRKNTLNK